MRGWGLIPALFVLAVSGGCGLFGPAEGNRCSSKQDCPGNYVCQVGRCVLGAELDASGPDSSATDRSPGRDIGPADRQRPDVGSTDAATTPDGGAFDGAAVDVGGADAGGIDAAAGDGGQADAASTDSATVDTLVVDGGQTDAAVTDAVQADTAAVDSASPDSASPDSASPDTGEPDAARPDAGFSGQPQLFAIHPPLALKSTTVTLEGEFPAGPLDVVFWRYATVTLDHQSVTQRLSVPVPGNASAGDVVVISSAGISEGVYFRPTTFTPKLSSFSPHYEQIEVARSMPRLTDVRRRHTAVAVLSPPADYLYVIGGNDNASKQSVERARLNYDGSLTQFVPQDSVLVTGRSGAAMALIGRRLYVLGGELGNEADTASSVEVADIDDAGELGGFSEVADMGQPRQDAQAVVIGRYLYVIGGRTAPQYQGTQAPNPLRAPILDDGSLGPFEEVTNVALAVPRDRFALEVAGSYLYLFGGTPSRSAVESCRIRETGDLESCQLLGVTLPTPVRGASSTRLGNEICVVGGEAHVDNENIAVSAVQCATIVGNGDLSAFDTSRSLTHPRAYFDLVRANNRIYTLGGDGVTGFRDDVEQAVIHYGAVLGAEQYAWADIRPVHHPACAVVGARLYVIGGSANGDIWATNNLSRDLQFFWLSRGGGISPRTANLAPVTLASPRYMHRLAVHRDRLYVIGGSSNGGAEVATEALAISGHDLGTPETLGSLSVERRGAVLTGAHGWLSIVGGYSSSPPTALASSERQDVPIPSLPWEDGPQLSTPRTLAVSAVLGQTRFVYGGGDGNYSSLGSIEEASLVGGGLDVFNPSNFALLYHAFDPIAAAVGGRLFVVGGFGSSGQAYQAQYQIQRSPLEPDGSLSGNFVYHAMLEEGWQFSGGCAVVVGNRVTVLGGRYENGQAGELAAAGSVYYFPIVDP